MVKLHLFSGFEKRSLGITPDMELGHLYDDGNSRIRLSHAAARVGVGRRRAQTSKTGLVHYDLWGPPLARAKTLFPIVSGREHGGATAGMASIAIRSRIRGFRRHGPLRRVCWQRASCCGEERASLYECGSARGVQRACLGLPGQLLVVLDLAGAVDYSDQWWPASLT